MAGLTRTPSATPSMWSKSRLDSYTIGDTKYVVEEMDEIFGEIGNACGI